MEPIPAHGIVKIYHLTKQVYGSVIYNSDDYLVIRKDRLAINSATIGYFYA